MRRRFVFGRPFVKRCALCYRTIVCQSVCPVCLSVLSVTLVYCGQTVGWIKMKLGTEVGLCLRQIVLNGDPVPLPQRGTSPQVFGYVCCGQMAVCIRISLGTEVGLSLGDIVLDGDLASPSLKEHSSQFLANVRWPNGWMD